MIPATCNNFKFIVDLNNGPVLCWVIEVCELMVEGAASGMYLALFNVIIHT